jgi:16S rRNA (adenine1518-N6/adenine1519-N6)-dimethyltransferase
MNRLIENSNFALMYTLKKSLGQHFLKDENISRKIVSAVEQLQPVQLLEIGPGGGALTKYLLQLPGLNFKAIELDEEKIEYLQLMYPAIKGKLIHQNFLEAAVPFEGSFVIVGNFPYNISSQILFKILEWKQQTVAVVGMFQKEVAQRIAAKEGNKSYGILSVLVQAFYRVEYLFDVHENCFNPPPKVKSGVICLTLKESVPEMKSSESFFLLVKTAFNQRRKMLRNGVKSLFDDETLKDELFTKRAEQLTVAQFAALTFRMK